MAKVQFYLTIKDGLEDLLGYIDDDLTEEMKTRMITCLNALFKVPLDLMMVISIKKMA